MWFGDHFLPSWWTFAQNPWLRFSMVGLRFTNSNTWLEMIFLKPSHFGPLAVHFADGWDFLKGLGTTWAWGYPTYLREPTPHHDGFRKKNEPAKMVSFCWGKINMLFISTIHQIHIFVRVLPFWLFAPLGGLMFTSWRRPRFLGLPLEVAPHGLTTHIHKPWHNHHDYP
jgi:hypothetical protein